MTQKERVEKFWNDFLEEKNLDKTLMYSDCYYFDWTQKSANNLLELVKEGKKCATTSLYIDGEFGTKIGEYNIITTYRGVPKAIIQIVDYKIMKFKDMTFELAVMEGEDEVFETWLENHKKFLSADVKNYGIKFNEDTPIVFEMFKLVYKK